MEPGLRLPIRPPDHSLTSHLLALDALAGQLATLTSRTRWPAQIPLNSKASFSGEIVHTNDVKVCVGGEWWVEMTAADAVEWVHRRKRWLLEEHARVTEGVQRSHVVGSKPVVNRSNTYLPPVVRFNPSFPIPLAALATAETVTAPLEETVAQEVETKAREITGKKQEHPAPASRLDKGKQKALATMFTEPSVNEEGLPFHEILETPDGTSLVPVPTASHDSPAPVLTDDTEKERSNYWSDDAAARREALRKKLFSQGSDTDDELDATDSEDERELPDADPADSDDEAGAPFANVPESKNIESSADLVSPASPSSAGLVSPAAPHEISVPETRSSSSSPTSPPTSRRSSLAPPSQPKSILKPPARKKSVSFDASVPLSPDSPDRPATRSGFPMPMSGPNISEFAPRPVPFIAEPKPAIKKAVGERGFAGFKPGFLQSTKPPAQLVDVPSPTDGGPEQRPAGLNAMVVESGKKPSLFAQRMMASSSSAHLRTGGQGSVEHLEEAAKTTPVEALSGPKGSASKASPALPKMSSAKETVGVKGAVVEHEPVQPRPTVPAIARNVQDDYEDSEDDYEEEEDEDEYDIDQALLAREIALDYHRRHAYESLRHDPSNPADEEEIPDMLEDEGGVMLGIPKIAMMDQDGKPMIVNPTPDDIRQYVRVGKLENGNLVLAPGEKGWSDDEDENDNETEAKRRVEEVKRQLLGRDVGLRNGTSLPVTNQPAPAVVRKESEVQLPPTVMPVKDIQETADAGAKVEEVQIVQQPKKVSRFKATRMGGA